MDDWIPVAHRTGKEEPLEAPPNTYDSPGISPDGTKMALQVEMANIRIRELVRNTMTRLTFDADFNDLPLWTPDGKRIAFLSQREQDYKVCWKASNGTGGMGEVSRAKDTRLGRTVAIKILHKGRTQRFERQLRAIAGLNHPNICTLHDIGFEGRRNEPLQTMEAGYNACHNESPRLGFSMVSLERMALAMDKPNRAIQAAIEYGIDVSQLEYILTLTPAERLRNHDAALALVLAARKAGIRYYGFDPRSPEASS